MLASFFLDEDSRRSRPVRDRGTLGRLGLSGVGGRGFPERRGFVFSQASSSKRQAGPDFCPTLVNLRRLGQISRGFESDSGCCKTRSPSRFPRSPKLPWVCFFADGFVSLDPLPGVEFDIGHYKLAFSPPDYPDPPGSGSPGDSVLDRRFWFALVRAGRPVMLGATQGGVHDERPTRNFKMDRGRTRLGPVCCHRRLHLDEENVDASAGPGRRAAQEGISVEGSQHGKELLPSDHTRGTELRAKARLIPSDLAVAERGQAGRSSQETVSHRPTRRSACGGRWRWS